MIDADQRQDLRRTFAAALDHDDPTQARTVLLASGWLDALDDDEPVAVSVLFRLQGETIRDVAALDDVLGHRLAATWSSASGDLAVAYPVARPSKAYAVTHVAFGAHRRARRLLWVDPTPPTRLQMVELDGAVSHHTIGGIDPFLGLVGFQDRPGPVSSELSGDPARDLWQEAQAAGRIALAHQLTAGALAMLSRATEYARSRRQFGVPIGTFQAVKHRLSDSLVAIAAADAAAVAAATSGTAVAAAIAKVLAGRAASLAGKNCLQVFGGIGFTDEHDFHRYFRRNLVLERFLGDGPSIERQLGTALRTGCLDDERLIGLDETPVTDLIDSRLSLSLD
jgi:hypothetical protein